MCIDIVGVTDFAIESGFSMCFVGNIFKSSIHFSRTIIKVVMEFLVTGRVTSTQDEIQAMHNQIRMLNSGKLEKNSKRVMLGSGHVL